MQRISLAWFSQIGIALRPLAALSSIEKMDWPQFFEAHTAKTYLDILIDSQQSHLQLRASRAPMRTLSDELDVVLRSQEPLEELAKRRFSISYFAAQLEPLLQGELSVQNAYLVWPKRAYDIEILIEDATRLLSDDVRNFLLSGEVYDIQQAGKCLAFEVPTAASFHLLRAADSVLRRYHRKVTGKDFPIRMRNWGNYIKQLRQAGADERVVSAIEQVKNLHRNPVIHPDLQMSIEDALSFVGIVESIVAAMMNDFQARSAAETTAALAAATAAVASVPSGGRVTGLLSPLIDGEGSE